MNKRGKTAKRKAVPYVVMLLCGMIIVVILAILLYTFIEQFKVLPLYEEDDSIANYLSLIGVSFSVTFITTSLLGGLSDKSEKIYWLSYPEHYLISKSLNFNVLSSIGFICLAIQVVMMFLKGKCEAVREAVFLSAFAIGIIAIVILTFKFTAVFFSRKKILLKVQSQFKGMVENPARENELKEAVVGIFNNTLEVTSVESSDLERIRENVSLLLDYEENETCSFWLTKLIIEIGRTNISLLIQLVSLIDNKKFTKYLNMAGNSRKCSAEFDEVMNIVFSLRLVELNKSLNVENLLWQKGESEVNIILTKIKTDNIANCIFLLEQLLKLPFEMLKRDACYNTVLVKWEDILIQFVEIIKEKEVGSYQRLQKYMFEFLTNHPGSYYSYDLYSGLCSYREQLGQEINSKTAKCIDELSMEELPFMIDVIETEKEKQVFLVWLTNQMAENNLPLKMWAVSKPSGYNLEGKKEYSSTWIEYIIKELRKKEEDVSKAYEAYRQKGVKDIYAENFPLWEYLDYVEKMTTLLVRVKAYERKTAHSSLEKFLEEVVSRVSLREENKYKYIVSVPCESGGEEIWEDTAVERIINCYTIVFDVLIKEGKDGLVDLCEALTIPHNYFEHEDEKKQKRCEMLFFLAQLNRIVKIGELSKDEIKICVGIMVRVLSNPCIAPICVETTGNPDEVNESLEYIQSNEVALNVAELFLEQLDYGQDLYSELGEIYGKSYSYESVEGFEIEAYYYKKVAKDYENALQSLKDSLSLG